MLRISSSSRSGANGKALPSAFNDNDVHGGRQRWRHVLQPGSGDRHSRPDGGSGQHRPNGGDGRSGPAVRLAPRRDRPVRRLLDSAGGDAVIQSPDGEALEALLGQARRPRRVLQPGRRRRRRSVPHRRTDESGAHKEAELRLRVTRPTGCVSTASRAVPTVEREIVDALPARIHLQLPPHIGGRGSGRAGDQARGDRPRSVRGHRRSCCVVDRRSGHQPTVVGEPRGSRCAAIARSGQADDGSRRNARTDRRGVPRRSCGPRASPWRFRR